MSEAQAQTQTPQTAAIAQPNPNQPAKAPAHSPAPKFFMSAESAEMRYIALCPGTVTIDDIMRPEYWRHVATRLKMHAVITCISDLGAFDVDLRVIEHRGDMVGVRPIRVVEYNLKDRAEAQIPEDAFKIQFIPNFGHGVRNKTSGKWLVQNLASQQAAEEWLRQYLAENRKS